MLPNMINSVQKASNIKHFRIDNLNQHTATLLTDAQSCIQASNRFGAMSSSVDRHTISPWASSSLCFLQEA